MASLTTTAGRIVFAIAAGLVLPTVMVGTPLAMSFTIEDEVPRVIAFVMTGLGSALVMLVLGAPLWIILHRRGAGVRAAAICGAVVGAVIGAALGAVMVLDPNEPVDAPLALMAPLMGAIGAAISGLTTSAMWWIAYPKSLQAPPAETYF